MSRIRGKNPGPGALFVARLRRRRLFFSRYASDYRSSDIVFRRVKLAIFIDGSFWHGWRFPLWQHEFSRKWGEKITTRRRDQRNFRKLRRMGWRVIRLWEHQIDCDLNHCLDRILKYM